MLLLKENYLNLLVVLDLCYKKRLCPDYDCWLGLLRLTNCDYIDEPLFYYDSLHGAEEFGNNYFLIIAISDKSRYLNKI